MVSVNATARPWRPIAMYSVFALMAGMVAAVTGAGIWSINRTDSAVAERQNELVALGLDSLRRTTGRTIARFAVSADLAAAALKLPASATALDAALRPVMVQSGYSHLAMLNQSGAVIYSVAVSGTSQFPMPAGDLAALAALSLNAAPAGRPRRSPANFAIPRRAAHPSCVCSILSADCRGH